ncbi:hypothetical protein NDU88_006625 [Pleurodeles waltl]|uniref:Uncharacterized protein n=1 Tax=Pleurodeles waltl TaxID=8319 RepID=A0AAV7N410_PLEWA|nr:hypothetical protein NDU88_006625 [Pleurodeles waltl]
MYGVSKKCSRGTSNRREPTIFKDFWDQEEGLARDDVEERKEDVDYGEKAETRKDTATPPQGSGGDPKEVKDVKESDEEEEQKGETGGEGTTPGAVMDREPDREEFTTRRPRHIHGGTWLHKVRAFINNRAPIGVRGHEEKLGDI